MQKHNINELNLNRLNNEGDLTKNKSRIQRFKVKIKADVTGVIYTLTLSTMYPK